MFQDLKEEEKRQIEEKASKKYQEWLEEKRKRRLVSIEYYYCFNCPPNCTIRILNPQCLPYESISFTACILDSLFIFARIVLS